MRRWIAVLSATLTLSVATAVAVVAEERASGGKEKGKEMITCPITNQQVEKSKAIAVKTMSGKTVYVCCKGCVAAAKQLK